MAGFKINNSSSQITGTDGIDDRDSGFEYLDDGIDFWMFGVDDRGFFWIGWWFVRWLMLGMY